MTTPTHSAKPQTKTRAWVVVAGLAALCFVGSFIVPGMVHPAPSSAPMSSPTTSVSTVVRTPAPTVIVKNGKPSISFPPPSTSFSTVTAAPAPDMSGHYARQDARTLAKKLRIVAGFLAIVAAVMAAAPSALNAMEKDNERTRAREQEAEAEAARQREWEAANPPQPEPVPVYAAAAASG
ncbi:MAG: hypothetical protein KDB26_05710 [Microthrixaceae bacterium]|nr:hypothetical protein [Microthrixaceae bacterium]